VNQKRRTRSALIAAAQAILDRGETPTVAKAAQEALVSRTTAYSYFPTQESLLLELSINFEMAELEQLVSEPLNGATPQQRVLEIVDLLNREMLGNEKLCRTAIRHYNDAWLVAERTGESQPSARREGRRRRWIATALEPLRGATPEAELRRVEAALCLVTGGEAITVLRDICQLEPDEAVLVARWAAEAILARGVQGQPVRASQLSTAMEKRGRDFRGA